MRKFFYLSSLGISCFILCSLTLKAQSGIGGHIYFPTNPANVATCSGTVAIFDAVVADTPGTPTLHRQWEVSTDNGSTWSALSSGGIYTVSVTADSLSVQTNRSLNGYQYRINVTDSSSTANSLSGILTVDTANAGTITGPSMVCVGSAITLNDDSSGGTWSRSNSNAFLSGGVVTGLVAGRDSISYSITNACGATVAISVITINALPATGVITGPDSVCLGSTVTLADTLSGGVWSSADLSVATIGSGGIVTGEAEGFDTIKYTTTTGFCTNYAYAIVRVDTNATALPVSGPTSTCVGHVITLTDPNTHGMPIWTTSNGTATVSSIGDVTGVSYGADTIYYQITNACNTTGLSSYVVSIDTSIGAGTISGASSLCAGSWTALSESVPGGSWFSSNSAVAVVDAFGRVTGVSQGSAVISYYLTDACGSSITTHAMTVDTVAGTIFGRDSVGIGNTRTLTCGTLGGIWSSNDTIIATANASGVATGISIGVTTITYTVTNACGTTDAVFTMNVGAHPSPGTISPSPDSVCIGHTLDLTSTVSGGVWSSANDSFASIGIASGIVTGVALDSGVAARAINITYTFTNGFGDSSVTVPVVVVHTPIITISDNPPLYALAANYLIKGSPAGGKWSHTNDSIATILVTRDSSVGGVDYATFVSYIMYRVGTDTLKYTVTNRCGTADSVIVTYIPPVAEVKNINSNELALNVYPNPSNGAFTMVIGDDNNSQASVIVTNIVGEKVAGFTISTNKLVPVQLDQPAGVYFISANTTTGKCVSKITIAK